MNKKLGILFFVVVFALCSVSVIQAGEYTTPKKLIKEATAQIKEVSIHDVKKMIDNKEDVIILDIRDPAEYEEKGHIPGAIHMSRGLLDLHVQEIIPDKNAKIVVYWIFDKRSPLATKSLNDLGYKNAVNMKDGTNAWKKAGYPLETGGKAYKLNY